MSNDVRRLKMFRLSTPNPGGAGMTGNVQVVVVVVVAPSSCLMIDFVRRLLLSFISSSTMSKPARIIRRDQASSKSSKSNSMMAARSPGESVLAITGFDVGTNLGFVLYSRTRKNPCVGQIPSWQPRPETSSAAAIGRSAMLTAGGFTPHSPLSCATGDWLS